MVALHIRARHVASNPLRYERGFRGLGLTRLRPCPTGSCPLSNSQSILRQNLETRSREYDCHEHHKTDHSPPCVMRRPNGRCSLSGLVWPSPDSTSSHLQISDAARFQQRQLLGEALATTPFRRQERDFLPQRLSPEIGRVPVRRTRDSKDALEKPAVSGHFRRVSTCRQKT